MLISRRRFAQLSLAGLASSCFPALARAQADGSVLDMRQEAIISDHLTTRGGSDYVDYARIGDHKIATRPTYTYLDQDSTVQVVVFLSESTPNPRLVVFSHGGLSEPTIYRNIINHWVSHGFMVVAPVHDDSIIRQGLNIRHSDARGGSTWDFSGLLNDHDLWRNRTSVCNLVLDNVPMLSRTFGVEINAERPIIAGHAYGAYAAQLLLGAKVQIPEGIMSLYDPRWAGGILMSPQGTGIMGLDENSWDEVRRPLMVMTGGLDQDASGQDAARKADPFWHSPAGYKHFAYMEYAQHTIFTGQSARPNTYEERLFGDVKATSVAFLKAYAEHDVTAYAHLQDDYFSAHSVEPENAQTRRPRHSRLFMQSR